MSAAGLVRTGSVQRDLPGVRSGIGRFWRGVRIGTLAVACGGCAAAAAPERRGSLRDFELPSLDGDTVRLSEHLGKNAILLTFWETRCEPCLRQMPIFSDLYRDYKDRGLLVLAISVDGPLTRGAVRGAAADHEMTFPVLLDEDTSVIAQYNPKATLPYTLLIDRRRNTVLEIVGKWVAERDPGLDRAIERALAP